MFIMSLRAHYWIYISCPISFNSPLVLIFLFTDSFIIVKLKLKTLTKY